MELRILGARQGESRNSHFASLLVDGILALDAGGLTSTLTLEEQAAIRAVLLTHHHFDHIKDLGTLGFNSFERGQLHICCTEVAREAIGETVTSDRIWIDFFTRPAPEKPTFLYSRVEPGQPFTVEGYRVNPIPVKHTIPAVGYELTAPAGGTILYTGDNGPGSAEAWASCTPDVLITETTYPNALAQLAGEHGHLAPTLLTEELRCYRRLRGFLPKVLIVHINPFFEGTIRSELDAVASEVGADITVAEEGTTITVS